jgi:hypothetical protein
VLLYDCNYSPHPPPPAFSGSAKADIVLHKAAVLTACNKIDERCQIRCISVSNYIYPCINSSSLSSTFLSPYRGLSLDLYRFIFKGVFHTQQGATSAPQQGTIFAPSSGAFFAIDHSQIPCKNDSFLFVFF